MRRRRGRPQAPAHDLCRGPGNLARALGITLADNRTDLTRVPARGEGLWIEDRGIVIDAREMVAADRDPRRDGARVAVFVAGNVSVSGRRTGVEARSQKPEAREDSRCSVYFCF